MCRCTPNIRTPWCGRPGCEMPAQQPPKPEEIRWAIVREADDPLALRLSIGSPNGNQFSIERHGYIVYRGDTKTCIKLLETALRELKKHFEEQGE